MRIPITALAAAAVLAAALPLRAAFVETHLNEITAPVADYAAARVAVLGALTTPTKAEKKELKILRALSKRLSKTAFALKQDFAELVAAGVAADQLGAAAAPMQPSGDEAVRRANLSLSERVELARDYLALLTIPKHRTAVQKAIDAVATKRAAAGTATKAAARAAALARADAAVTTALRTADRFVLKDVGAEKIPPTRWRSGDSIGFGGGRVAVPLDSGSSVAGASIVFPIGLLTDPIAITLEPAATFVGGRDLAAGPALAVGPDATALGGDATLYIPYQLPDGASALDLALFAAGPPVSTIYPVTPLPDGTMQVAISTLSTYEAGIPAPPPGQPSGTYQVETILLGTTLDPTGTGNTSQTDFAAISAGVFAQAATFRPDHTASLSVSGISLVDRTFTPQGTAHHTDAAQSSLLGSSDFTWTPGSAGRFTFTLALGNGTSAPMQGVASDDGRVVAWTGRGGTVEFLTVGVKTDPNTVTSQLAGRWAAVETGVQLLDDGVEPFRTRRHDAFRAFSVDGAGAVTFEQTGTRFETDVTYHSSDADPVHTRAENVVADGASETWSIDFGGRLTESVGRRGGWFDPAAGLLVTTLYDATSRRVALMVAVRQPATGDPSVLPGLYHWAGVDVGTSVGTPTAESSTHDVTPSFGSFDVQSATSATLSTDDAMRFTYTLSTAAPPASFLWTMTSAAAGVSASSVPVTLSLDAAGNHTAPADEFWYAFSGDGRYVLRLTRGEAMRLARGFAIGVR
jgi:hypothetical protein